MENYLNAHFLQPGVDVRMMIRLIMWEILRMKKYYWNILLFPHLVL